MKTEVPHIILSTDPSQQLSLLDDPRIDERKVLKLSLKSAPFEVMFSQEKSLEYRENGHWIRSRMNGKHYTHVQFTNGYGANRPYFVAEYNGFYIAANPGQATYSNGLTVEWRKGDYVIMLGKVVEAGNLRFNTK